MKKFLSYIIILIALVGIFGFVSIKQAKADQCVLTGWTYASCHNGTGAMTDSIYTGTQSTPQGSQETCTTGNTNMSQATCGSNSGQWYPPGNPPSTQEGVSVSISNPGAPVVGGMCTGQAGTPPGCNATINVPGSSCVISQWNTSEECLGGVKTYGLVPFFSSDTCRVPGWSPASCQQNYGTYYPPGQTPGTVSQNINSYTLLAPLPNTTGGQLTSFDLTDTHALGKYLNIMINIFIGICAVLAMIMILMGGIEYMTSELVSSKEAGKERIRNALFGLILALGAWTLLYTINPNLLNSDVNIASVAADASDLATLAKSDQTVSSVGGGYKTNTPDAGVADFATNNCSSLNNITVDTTNKQASFCANSNCVTVPINIGYNGVAQPGTAQDGDAKTPIGTYKLGSKNVGSNGNAVISNGYNFGAAFVNIGVTDSNGVNRGIGFHGNASDTLGKTNGCVRMSNDDLALLAPCMQSGTNVTIK